MGGQQGEQAQLGRGERRRPGERLYISQNTVKTQAISVYRKLGVSSCGKAVQRVQAIGLLGA